MRLIILVVLAMLSAGCLGPVKGLYPPRPGEEIVTIHLVNNGWHTGIALPATEIDREVWDYEARGGDAPKWLEVGWGDRGFYRDSNAWTGFAAALLPTPGILHIVETECDPAERFAGFEMMAIDLSRAGFNAMTRRISKTFKRDEAGRPIVVGPGLAYDATFYEAHGVFIMPITCNRWTADTLRAAGYPVTPCCVITSSNLFGQVRGSAERMRGAVSRSSARSSSTRRRPRTAGSSYATRPGRLPSR